MSRKVLITGSEGHLGRALRAAFEAQGDKVIGIDQVAGDATDYVIELGLETISPVAAKYDVVVCNAKTYDWQPHNMLAGMATSAVINIGSIYGVLGNDPTLYTGTEVSPTPPWYVAAKGAMVALTRWQATNLAPVRSNCIAPGGIFRGHSDEFVRRYSDKVPLKRMATESDIVPMVLFLASDAASYITGQTIMVDGGYSAW